MLTQRQLKAAFREYDFRPLKRYGENYLIDANIKDKIINAADISQKDTILEIGPGLGALTIDLAARGAKVFAVEKDKKAFGILSDIVGDRFPNLKLVNDDILDFDIMGVSKAGKLKVLGNLPYYIATPIVERLIENSKTIKFAVIMVQREVANRMLALPKTENYSSLSCFIRYYTNPSYIHTVKRTSFYPAPKVDSSIIKLEMRDAPSVKVGDEALLFRIIRGAFQQRRKSIVNSISRQEVLNTTKDMLSETLQYAAIDPSARPETLSLEDFARLTDAITRRV